jgi:Flp pilus assembly protein CpaB
LEKEILKETAPKNALTKFEEVKGRQLKIPRREGDTITQDDLHDDKTPTLMGMLPPGHRAVGVRVSAEQIASGFAAVPHSRIDIACSVRCNNDKDCGTRIILQNVLVLASGQATVRDEGGKAMLCDVVTVALTPEDALKLETSKSKGGLTMFLRPFGETSIVKTGNVTWETVIAKKTDEKDDADSDSGPKSNSAVPSLDNVPITAQAAPTPFQPPTNDKFVQRITNQTTVRVIYTKDADGQYESRTETVDPSDTVSATPGARSAPRPGTAAPEQKR